MTDALIGPPKKRPVLCSMGPFHDARVVECHAGRPQSSFPAVLLFTGRDSNPTMSTRPASFSQRREVGF
jgi:hypothetical protein